MAEGVDPAAEHVERAPADRPFMSWINLGEVSYIVERAKGAEHARGVVRHLQPRLRLDLPDESRILEGRADWDARHSPAARSAEPQRRVRR